MKLYTINPLYTSFFSVIILAALTSSFSLYYANGKTYLDLKYEIVYGGNKTLRIDGAAFPGLKSYKRLTADETSKLQQTKKKIEMQKKREWEEREKVLENERKQCVEKERLLLEEERERDQKRVESKTEIPISQKRRTPKNIQNKPSSRGTGRKKLPQKKN